MQREVARQRRDGGIVKVEIRIKTIPHPTPSGAFGPGDKKSRDGLFATRGRVGGDCSAFDLWGLAAPCCAIFRHKGGMDPAPLLAFKIGFEALVQTM